MHNVLTKRSIYRKFLATERLISRNTDILTPKISAFTVSVILYVDRPTHCYLTALCCIHMYTYMIVCICCVSTNSTIKNVRSANIAMSYTERLWGKKICYPHRRWVSTLSNKGHTTVVVQVHWQGRPQFMVWGGSRSAQQHGFAVYSAGPAYKTV